MLVYVFSSLMRANNWPGVFVNDMDSQIFTLDTQLSNSHFSLDDICRREFD